MALPYPSRDILDRLVRQPFRENDLVPAMIGVAEFGYRSAENRARRRCVFGVGPAYVHRSFFVSLPPWRMRPHELFVDVPAPARTFRQYEIAVLDDRWGGDDVVLPFDV